MSIAKSSITPMMVQFLKIKESYPEALLFYRMGDFYEMFFDDAVAAAQALGIALTKRGKHLGKDIPMCGVPVHAAERYLHALIQKGFRVAVCEQMEDPAEAKKRGAKSVVKRDVVRLVTPGTLTEESLLKPRQHNFLAAYAMVREQGALAWVDISTGEFKVTPCPLVRLSPELAQLAPQEVIVPERLEPDLFDLVTELGCAVTPLSAASFDSASATKRLTDVFEVNSLDAFGQFDRAEIAAMGAIVDYLEITQKGNLPRLRKPSRELASRTMQIDATTRQSLELTKSLFGGREGSLIQKIDRTLTAGGARLFERRLSNPSSHLETIQSRLNVVDFFVSETRVCEDTRAGLRKSPDIDRALSRLSMGRGGPRDLAAIKAGLDQAKTVAKILTLPSSPEHITMIASKLVGLGETIELLNDALISEPPILTRDGGFIAPDYNNELDEYRTLRDQGRGVIASLQSGYAKLAAIPSLKIKHNNVLGYFVDVTSLHTERMLSAPLSETFIHRQTTANSTRFTTVELSELETKILNAGRHVLEIEMRIFADLVSHISQTADSIADVAMALSEIDLSTAIADLSTGENWCRPVVDDSHAFLIDQGRHPVVEAALKSQSAAPFVANDCYLSDTSDGANIWLLTGPNMAGKSTFLRQNALIALLAQMGSYVPAKAAHIGIVSQLFSRVGASDDLARGRSTFMVEMVETAAILNQANDRALVILDEIGRGTATYDGLSIAWATLEHLHQTNKCRALFATHYHEMTALAEKLDGVENATVLVKEWEGEVVFLHEVRKGAADRSYGIQVAKLSGLPASVVARARVVLESLEKGEREKRGARKSLMDDLPLFSVVPAEPSPNSTGPTALEKTLVEIHPDELTPKQALALIYELKALTKPGSS